MKCFVSSTARKGPLTDFLVESLRPALIMLSKEGEISSSECNHLHLGHRKKTCVILVKRHHVSEEQKFLTRATFSICTCQTWGKFDEMFIRVTTGFPEVPSSQAESQQIRSTQGLSMVGQDARDAGKEDRSAISGCFQAVRVTLMA